MLGRRLRHCQLGSIRTTSVLLAFNEVLHSLLKALSRLDHGNHELALEEAVIARDVLVEALVAATGPYQKLLSLELAGGLARADQVQLSSDVLHWDRDAQKLDLLHDGRVQRVAFPGPELDWRVREQVIALEVQLRLG